jgi:hypothetical protein
MKLLRLYGCVIVFLTIIVLQSCGSGKSDTNGSLTIGTPTVTDQKCGYYTVAATVTFTPPTGKDPNGEQVTVSEYENNILMDRTTDTLTSSPSVTHTYLITQSTTAPTIVTINAAIGSMTSSILAVVPVFTNTTGCSK